MAWTASAMFRQWPKSAMGHGQTAAVLPAGYAGLGADTIKVALFNSTITPDKDATLVTTGYNSASSQWLTSAEVTSSTQWPAGGQTLANKAFSVPSTGVMMFDADDTAGGGTVTLTDANGCLVYDDTITAGTGGIADQGITFHWFGGAQSVTAGTFTIVWNALGLFRISV